MTFTPRVIKPAADKRGTTARRRTATPPPAASGRTPPVDLEAEASVLGSILLDPDAIGKVAGWLQPEDFYRESSAVIYRAALNLDSRRQPVDNITLASEL